MTEPSTVKRRHLLTGPGESFLLTTDPIEHYDRFDRFIEMTGLPESQVLSSPAVRFPIPVPLRGEDGLIRRWEGVNPSAMWVPLFWMPERLAMRYRYSVIPDEQGGTEDDYEIESDDVWAMRVMLELTNAGLFNPVDGTWADVLSAYGLDADNTQDQARIHAWLSGGTDPILDSIDLHEAILHTEDPEWALKAALELSEVIIPAQWSLTATGLLLSAQLYMQDEGDAASTERRRAMVKALGSAAANDFRSMPPTDDLPTYTDYFHAIVREADRDGADIDELTEGFLAALAEISDDFQPQVDACSEAFASSGASAA